MARREDGTSRRRVLASLAGGLTGLAGCSASSLGLAPPPTVTDDGPLAVSVQETVYATAADSEVLLRDSGSQYLVVESAALDDGIEVQPSRECRAPVTVRLDGGQVVPDEIHCLGLIRASEFAARLPVQSAERGTVAVLDTRRRLTSETLDAIGRRPEFRLHQARVVGAGEGATLEVTVGNEGDRDGVWRGLRKRTTTTGTVRLELSVPAGERRTGVVERLGPPTRSSDRQVVTEVEPDTRYLRLGPQ